MLASVSTADTSVAVCGRVSENYSWNPNPTSARHVWKLIASYLGTQLKINNIVLKTMLNTITKRNMHHPLAFTEAENDITIHVHGYWFTSTVTRSRSRLLVHVHGYSFTFSIADPSVLRKLAGSKDTSAEMLYLQFQLSLIESWNWLIFITL